MEQVISFDRLPIEVAQIGEKVNRIECLVMQLVKPTTQHRPSQFGFGGLLEYLHELGLTFSKSQLQKSTASGKIPCHKFNNRLVFVKDEIDEWIESKREPIGQSDAALTLAVSANRKLRRS